MSPVQPIEYIENKTYDEIADGDFVIGLVLDVLDGLNWAHGMAPLLVPELIAAQSTLKTFLQMRLIFRPSASDGDRRSTSFRRTTAEKQIRFVANYCPSIARKVDIGQSPAHSRNQIYRCICRFR